MKTWINNNKTAASAIALTILFIAVAMLVQGCDLQRMVKFEVPSGVAAAVDSPEQETLANAQVVWEEWTAYVDRNSNRLSASIEDANNRFAVISSLTNTGLGFISDSAASLPGGAFIVSGISMLAGLFLKRPGEDKRVQIEKEDSYNAGMEKGAVIASGDTSDD